MDSVKLSFSLRSGSRLRELSGWHAVDGNAPVTRLWHGSSERPDKETLGRDDSRTAMSPLRWAIPCLKHSEECERLLQVNPRSHVSRTVLRGFIGLGREGTRRRV
jgi:hypothetical protein